MPPHTCFKARSLVNYAAEHAVCHARKSMRNQRKFVSFNEDIAVRTTSTVSAYSDAEIQAYWFQNDEFRRIKKNVKFEAHLLEKDCLDDDSNMYCSRGLEPFTTAGTKRRTANMRRVLTLVLEEQELQREEGSNDPEYIAEIYAACQAVARKNAEKNRLHANRPTTSTSIQT